MDRCYSQGFHSAHIIFLEWCHSFARHVGLVSFFQVTFCVGGAGWHVCYSERVELRGQPLSTMWAPGIEFRPSCLVANALTHVAISPALIIFFVLILRITATQLGVGRDSQNCLELGLSVESTALLIYRSLLPAMVELNSHRFAHLYHFLISMIKVSAV